MDFLRIIGVMACVVASAAALEPYQADQFTLHLWHFDEDEAPFSNSSTSTEFPLQGQFNGAVTQASTLPGFGNAVSFHHNAGGSARRASFEGAIVTLSPVLANGEDDNSPPGFRCAGHDGAFTYEALLKLDLLPSEAPGIGLDLITFEGDSFLNNSDRNQSDEARLFHFRIERDGFLLFNPLPGSGSIGGALAAIPTAGLHAIDTENWFHVAVCYSGEEGVVGNLKFYWTCLAHDSEEANLIGGGTLSNDFLEVSGDFAIGNEARSANDVRGGDFLNREAEPFPGLLDEVRMSSVARHPSDFLFVAPSLRVDPVQFLEQKMNPKPAKDDPFVLQKFWVDGEEHPISFLDDDLVRLAEGNHRLDFDFGFRSHHWNQPMAAKSQLEGFDRVWRETGQGMVLVFQLLDENGEVLSESLHSAFGRSSGWDFGLARSVLKPFTEPLFIPVGARSILVKLSSGPPDTTGYMALDDLTLTFAGSEKSIWPNGRFNKGRHRESRSGLPDHWRKGGSNLAIPQALNVDGNLLIVLIDNDQNGTGEWLASLDIPKEYYDQRSATVKWNEAYNVIEGSQYRSTYLNVPAGKYTFMAMGISSDGSGSVSTVNLPLEIPISLVDQPWFRPAVIGGLIFLVALYLFDWWRRMQRRKLRAAQFESTLQKDRSRIASNLHDDLGTRASVIDLAASLAAKEISRDPEKASRHLSKLKSCTRGLTLAMDELVWAVDPSHDTLEDLASHLMRVSDEVLSGTGIKVRLDIPEHLPALVFRSEYRHHMTLSVKEALHNALKHSESTEVKLSLRVEVSELVICVADNGRGFDPKVGSSGLGLKNFKSRLGEISGTCEVASSPGIGTSVIFRSPLEQS